MPLARQHAMPGTVVPDRMATRANAPAASTIERILSHADALSQYQEIGRRLFPQPLPTTATLSVCGVAPDQGTSTTAVGLAAALASTHKENILLVECDFTHPSLAERLRVPGRPGLGALLDGSGAVADVLRSTPLPNLLFVPAGRTDHPSALHRDEVAAALADLAATTRAAVLVLDVPPVVTERTGRVWCELSTHVVLVVRCGLESASAAQQSVDLLGSCSLAGVVLNQHTSAVPAWVARLAARLMRPGAAPAEGEPVP